MGILSKAEKVPSLPKIVPPITTEWLRFEALSAAALYELLRFRQQIFVVEQRSPYLDLDGLDAAARHLMLRREGSLVGCLRLLSGDDAAPPVHIGRVAVAAQWRGRGLGRRLMTEALAFCHEHHRGQPIRLSAQSQQVGFYRGFGFREIGPPYDDFGVPHVDMLLSP
jgi:ElaA protein